MPRSRLYPPSVRPGIPKLGPCPPGWRTVKLRDLFDVMSRPAELVPDQRYQLVTVKRSRGGVVAREELRGDEIKTPTQFYVKEGDFVISRRQIIHGACGFIPAELDGAVVSNEYDVLRPRPELVPGFLRELVHTEYMQRTFFQSSVGVDIEKMVFDLDAWLEREVNLPPILEQMSAADALHLNSEAIARAGDERRQAQRSWVAILQMLMAGRGSERGWTTCSLSRIASVSYGLTVNPERASKALRVPYFRVANLVDGALSLDDVAEIGVDAHELPTRTLQLNDLLLVEGNANPRRLGDCAIWLNQLPTATHQNHLIRVRVASNVVLADFLRLQILSAGVRRQILHEAKSTSGLSTINSSVVANLQIRYPNLAAQREIVAVVAAIDLLLNRQQAQMDALTRLKTALQQSLLSGRLRVKV